MNNCRAEEMLSLSSTRQLLVINHRALRTAIIHY